MELLEGIVYLLSEIKENDLQKIKLFSDPKHNALMFNYLARAAELGALDRKQAENIFNSIQVRIAQLKVEKPDIASKIKIPNPKPLKSMKPKEIVDASKKYFDQLQQFDKYGAIKVKQQTFPILKKLPDEVEPMEQPPELPTRVDPKMVIPALPDEQKPSKSSSEPLLPYSSKGTPLPPKKGAKPDIKGKPLIPPDAAALAKASGLPIGPGSGKQKPKPPPLPMKVTPDMMIPPDLPRKTPPPLPMDRNVPSQKMKNKPEKQRRYYAGQIDPQDRPVVSDVPKDEPKKDKPKKKGRPMKVRDKDIMGAAESVVREQLDKKLSEMIFKFFNEEIL